MQDLINEKAKTKVENLSTPTPILLLAPKERSTNFQKLTLKSFQACQNNQFRNVDRYTYDYETTILRKRSKTILVLSWKRILHISTISHLFKS